MATLRLCERFGCLPDVLEEQSTRVLRLVAAERAYLTGRAAGSGPLGVVADG